MEKSERTRIDKYVWAIRLYKTRSLAQAAADAGRIKLNGEAVKAAHSVKINDLIELKTESRNWLIKVVGLIDKRVGYPEAITKYLDITPEEQKEKKEAMDSAFFTGKRMSKTGKPSKDQRRNREKFFGEE